VQPSRTCRDKHDHPLLILLLPLLLFFFLLLGKGRALMGDYFFRVEVVEVVDFVSVYIV